MQSTQVIGEFEIVMKTTIAKTANEFFRLIAFTAHMTFQSRNRLVFTATIYTIKGIITDTFIVYINESF